MLVTGMLSTTYEPSQAIELTCVLFNQPNTFAAIEAGVDLNLFAALSKDDTPKMVDELAEATGADPALLSKFMRSHLGLGLSDWDNIRPFHETPRRNGGGQGDRL